MCLLFVQQRLSWVMAARNGIRMFIAGVAFYSAMHGSPLSAQGANNFQISPAISGNWYDPIQPGHGFAVEVLPNNGFLAEWFVYAPQGGQAWVFAQGTYSGNTATLTAAQDVGPGAVFPPYYDPNAVQQQIWGTVTFVFADSCHAQVSYASTIAGYGSGSLPLIRLTQPAMFHAITVSALQASGQNGVAFKLPAPVASGGVPPYRYQFDNCGGSPPSGSTIDPSTGVVSIPASAAVGSYAFDVCAVDTGGQPGCTLATVTITAAGGSQKPNLTPYQPQGWSDKIVVSSVTGTNTDSASLQPTDTLYVDWAVENGGSASVTARFYIALYVDGVDVSDWYQDPPLDPQYYAYIDDFSIGSLSAGSHTIKIVADSTGVIGESSESDNQYTKTITIGSTAGSPTYLPGTSCPVDSNLQCSQWLANGTGCNYQSCTCYFNTPGVGSDDSGFWHTQDSSGNPKGTFDCKLNGGLTSLQISQGICNIQNSQVSAFVASCTTTAPACTYSYSAWSACQSNNTQTRTVLASSPSGCVGTPVLTQACNYSGGSGDWYFHWNCNGDAECLATNPTGAPSGSLDEGPVESSCTQLITFSQHFWGPGATYSCDHSP